MGEEVVPFSTVTWRTFMGEDLEIKSPLSSHILIKSQQVNEDLEILIHESLRNDSQAKHWNGRAGGDPTRQLDNGTIKTLLSRSNFKLVFHIKAKKTLLIFIIIIIGPTYDESNLSNTYLVSLVGISIS